MNWRRFFGRSRADADHAREFQSFLEFETDENIARGMSPDAARSAAHRKFGSPAAIREQIYLRNSAMFLEALGRDLRYAVRVLKKAPAFTLVSLLTLALGIGATAAIFTVVNGVILRPLPYPDPDQLVTAWETNPTYNMPSHPPGAISFSPGNYLDLRQLNRSFQQVGAFATTSFNLTGAAAPDRIAGALVSPALFSALRLRPAVGRLLVPSDDSLASARVAVLSHALWVERFDASPAAIGKSILLDDKSHTIVGVMPPDFRLFNEEVDVWLPLERKTAPEDMHWRRSYYLRVIGRLKPGVTLRQAQQDVDRIVHAILRQYPNDLGRGGMVVPLLDNTISRARTPLWILFGAVGFVLLIACANLAHLALGRAMNRRREIALRLALGADRYHVVRQLFTESLLLAMGGATLGICFAAWSVPALLKLAPGQIPRAAEIHVDAWVSAFAISAAAASAIVFGLLPALSASSTGLQPRLQASAGSQRARNSLVISEIALALVLMIGAGLMIESFRRVSAVDPGFDPRGLVTMRVALSPARYDSLDRQNAFYQRMIDRLREMPGLKSVAAIDGLPFADGGFDNAFSIDDRPEPPAGRPLKADIRRVDHGYFAAIGIPVLEGRAFTAADRTDSPPVVIVSRSMKRKYWPGEPAFGKRLTLHFGPPEGIRAEIVGVAADVRSALDATPNDYIYLPYPQARHVAQMDLVLRPDPQSHAAAAGAFGRAVRAAVASLDPDQPVYRIRTMDDLLAVSLATRRFEMLLLALFAALAAGLAAIGLYGVLAYTVLARTREIGIRTALGANHAQVSAMILKEALALTAAGVAAGILGALALTRLLSTLLFGIAPNDPATFILVSFLLLAVSVSAACLPARRAARIDPMIALRHD